MFDLMETGILSPEQLVKALNSTFQRSDPQEERVFFRIIWQVKGLKRPTLQSRQRDKEARAALAESQLGSMARLASAYHRKTSLPVADLFQQACLLLVESIDKVPQGSTNPGAYLYQCVKVQLIRSFSHERLLVHSSWHVEGPTFVSLDEPLFEDDTLTLADTIVQPQPEPPDDSRSRLLYDALRRLPLQQQRALKEHFKLEAFIPLGSSLNVSRQTTLTAATERKNALKHLKKDRMLALSFGLLNEKGVTI